MEPNRYDRRYLRSRQLLSAALIELLQEKRYIDITVQDIIARANVGRSTFYAHYQDKEDLLISSLETTLENLIHPIDDGQSGQAALSTLEFFRHVQAHQDLYRAMLAGRGIDLLFGKGLAMISQKIEGHLENSPLKGRDPSVPIPVVANFLAGSFLTLLKWWIDHKLPYSPEQMEAIYQQLVMPGTLGAIQELGGFPQGPKGQAGA